MGTAPSISRPGAIEDSFLYALDAATGSVQYRTAYLNQWSHYFAPVIVGSVVYAAGGYYGGMYAFNTSDLSQRWFAALNQYDQFTPAVKDTFVYAYTGSYQPKLTVTSANTGAISYEIADPGFVWDGWSMNSAPTLGGAANVLATNGGRLISFSLSSRSIGYALAGNFRGQPTVANGVVYVANSAQVEARKESDGSLQWSWAPPEGQPTGPMIATKNLLLVSTAANTYAVDLASHAQVWTYPAGGAPGAERAGILVHRPELGEAHGGVDAVNTRGSRGWPWPRASVRPTRAVCPPGPL